jgi:peptidoglycan biosynthesis protein MviN/MurJ (putative lipid II flippase)
MVFLVPIYIGLKHQISVHTDNFFLSYSIITFMAVIFSEAFRSVSIPFLQSKLTSKIVFDEFVSAIFHFIIKWLGISTIILILVFTLLYTYNNDELYWFLGLSSPIFSLIIINAFLSGILNSLDKFYIVEVSTLMRGAAIILTMFLLNSMFGLSAAIIGYVFGELIKALQLFFIIKKQGVQIRLKKGAVDIQPFLKTGSFQMISSAISSSFPLISKLVASFLAIGSISILDYGDRIFMVFNVLLNSFLIIILSKWSSELKEGNFKIKSFHQIIFVVFLTSLLALVFVALFNVSIVNLLYPKINFNNRKVISLILTLNMVGFVFNAVNQLINRATIASQGTQILIYNSIIKLLVNIVLSIWFASMWGVIGIAISLVLVHIIGLILNYFMFIFHIKKYTYNL